MQFILAAAIGLLAGAHISTWGMYKDSPHEGFTWATYARSIVLAVVLGLVWKIIIGEGIDLARAAEAVVLFGVVYVSERALTELYKGYIREEDQSKYFIPMQFHVGGRVVHDRKIRWMVGIAWVLVALLTSAAVLWWQESGPRVHPLVIVLVVGSIGGWLTAFGGAWKDAPIEGFDLLKFFRSPVVSFLWAALIALFTSNYLFIGLAGAGYSVATWETYKTFFFPSKPRGKFAGKPMPYTEMLSRRKWFVPIYVAVWAIVITLIAIALVLRSPGDGLWGGA
ncbi:MAG: hypothetical protein ACRENI_12635 [Gemmatimonadaceae bacterium]